VIDLFPGNPAVATAETLMLGLPIGHYGANSVIALFLLRHLPDEICLGDRDGHHLHARLDPRRRRLAWVYAWIGTTLMVAFVALVTVAPLVRILVS